jgi:hypothetical protein
MALIFVGLISMSKSVLKVLENVKPGDLISIDWCDASTGKSSLNGGCVDVPVKSWGIFLGVMGRARNIILAQNSFRYTDSLFDLDYTSVPAGWAIDIIVLAAGHVSESVAGDMLKSFAQASLSQSRSNTAGLRSPRMFEHHRMQRLRHGEPG